MENFAVKIERIVFTNGCFDILHEGHVRLLEYCASLGDVIVGINSDESVSRIKGPGRPLNGQDARKYLLSSIVFVKQVYIFEEDTPLNLIRRIKPDIIVKGGDYLASEVVGSDLAQIKIFPLVKDISTTKLLGQLSQLGMKGLG